MVIHCPSPIRRNEQWYHTHQLPGNLLPDSPKREIGGSAVITEPPRGHALRAVVESMLKRFMDALETRVAHEDLPRRRLAGRCRRVSGRL